MTACLNTLCDKACPVVTKCEKRIRQQSFTCVDAKSKSAINVSFVSAAQGIAFVTDHVIPSGSILGCDWCVCYCDSNRSKCMGVLIELKGGDFKHAVEQLASTLKAMKSTWPAILISQCHAVLSGKQIPSVKSSDYKVVTQYKLPGFKQHRARKGLSIEL